MIRRFLVASGMMISSIAPRFAALCALFCICAYSAVFSLISAIWSSLFSISFAYMMRTACSGSIIPILACGHASTKSAPMDLEFMITPAVPNAFPTIKFTFGTVLLIISFVKIARILAIFLSSSRLVFIPSTSVTVKTGMENASQNLINLVA